MNNTAYYQSIADAYAEVCGRSSGTNRVPTASYKLSKIYDEQYGYRKTASGKWRERDEPDEREQLRQADAINKRQQQRKAAASRERLKATNKVPTKATKRLFEDFMKEVNRRTGKKTNEEIKMDKNAKQIYLAARALDDFDKWVMFVVDML